MARITNNTNEYIKLFEKAKNNTLNEIGVVGKADLMSNCAVDTGTLRKGHSFKIDNSKVIFGNYINYAPYVEFRKKGGRPWFRKTIINDKDKFYKIIIKHFKGVK